MPLDESSLASLMSTIFDPQTSPRSSDEASDAWSNAYFAFTKDALAGPSHVIGLDKSIISSAIRGSSNFFAGLSDGITLYWLAASWIGGASGKISSAPPVSSILASIGSSIYASRLSYAEASREICQGLSMYTRRLVVNLLTPAGSPIVAPVT